MKRAAGLILLAAGCASRAPIAAPAAPAAPSTSAPSSVASAAPSSVASTAAASSPSTRRRVTVFEVFFRRIDTVIDAAGTVVTHDGRSSPSPASGAVAATTRVRFVLSAPDAARVGPEASIAFSLGAPPATELAARLLSTRPRPDATGAVDLEAELLGAPSGLRPGTIGAVRIVTSQRKGVIVPERAVVASPRGAIVFVVRGDEASARTVRVGPRLPGGVELLEGVAWGERLVVDGAGALLDHAPVEIVGEVAPGGAEP